MMKIKTVFDQHAEGAEWIIIHPGELRQLAEKQRLTLSNIELHDMDDHLELTGNLEADALDCSAEGLLTFERALMHRIGLDGLLASYAVVATRRFKIKFLPDVPVQLYRESDFDPEQIAEIKLAAHAHGFRPVYEASGSVNFIRPDDAFADYVEVLAFDTDCVWLDRYTRDKELSVKVEQDGSADTLTELLAVIKRVPVDTYDNV